LNRIVYCGSSFFCADPGIFTTSVDKHCTVTVFPTASVLFVTLVVAVLLMFQVSDPQRRLI